MNIKYTKESLELVIRDSKSWAEVCRKIGTKPDTGSQSHIKSRAVKFQIDFSHFLGMGWNRGGKAINRKDLKEFLVENSTVNSSVLLRRLIKEGLKEKKCEMCGLTEWLGYDIPLELDHKNNIHSDNRFENLSVLCPTCHALRHKLSRYGEIRQTHPP